MRIFLLAVLAVIITGCATSYREAGGPGNLGVKATIIDDNVFEVTSRINKSTPPYLRREYSVRKAAETSLKLGCNYFVAVGNVRQSFTQASHLVNTGLQKLDNGSLVYVSKSGTQYNVVNPSGMVVKYVCFNDKPDMVLPGLVFNAKYVLQS